MRDSCCGDCEYHAIDIALRFGNSKLHSRQDHLFSTNTVQLNPFSAFCLYVASRVFVQYLKSRPNDSQILGSLHFLLSAMHALKRKTPLAESFLAQLDVDLEGAGIPTDYESSVDSLKKKGFVSHNRRSMFRGILTLSA